MITKLSHKDKLDKPQFCFAGWKFEIWARAELLTPAVGVCSPNFPPWDFNLFYILNKIVKNVSLKEIRVIKSSCLSLYLPINSLSSGGKNLWSSPCLYKDTDVQHRLPFDNDGGSSKASFLL